VYSNDEEHFNDIAAAYRTELEILYNAGCRNVQIDDPLLACKDFPTPLLVLEPA
jgi:methionine synthase II (cobalamin-independent)